MLNSWFSGSDRYWSQRELMLCIQIFCNQQKTTYIGHDLILPYKYPRVMNLGALGQFKMLYTLDKLAGKGIKVKEILIDTHCFFEEESSSKAFYSTLKKRVKTTTDILHISRRTFKDFLVKHARNLLEKDIEDPYGDDGDVPPIIPPSLLKYIMIPLEINRASLKGNLKKYAGKIKAGKPKLKEGRVFRYSFTKQLIAEYFSELKQIQEGLLYFEFALNEVWDPAEDEFLCFFAERYPKEFEHWQTGRFELRIFDALLAYGLADKACYLVGFEVMSPNHVRFVVDPQVHKTFTRHNHNERLTLIEVETTNTKEYYIYLNGNYGQPFIMKKDSKFKRTLSKLAHQEEVLYHRELQSVIEYSGSKRCKFFTQTGYSPERFLTIDNDGYIVAADHIQIHLKK